MRSIRGVVLAASCAAAATVVGGCTAGAGYTTTGVYAKTYDPYYDATMVPVREGVWVVEGRTHPVFFSRGAYWRYRNGLWYRSRYIDDGYVRVRAVPPTIRTIQRPRRYIRYHSPTRTRVRVVPRRHYHRRY